MLSNAPKTIEKPWGSELVFPHANEQSTVKIMRVNPKTRNSLHYHTKKKEIIHCLQGTGTAQIDDQILKLIPGKTYFIAKNVVHRLNAFYDKELVVLEVSIGEYDENDIVRFEDDYGRK